MSNAIGTRKGELYGGLCKGVLARSDRPLVFSSLVSKYEGTPKGELYGGLCKGVLAHFDQPLVFSNLVSKYC